MLDALWPIGDLKIKLFIILSMSFMDIVNSCIPNTDPGVTLPVKAKYIISVSECRKKCQVNFPWPTAVKHQFYQATDDRKLFLTSYSLLRKMLLQLTFSLNYWSCFTDILLILGAYSMMKHLNYLADHAFNMDLAVIIISTSFMPLLKG